MESYERNVLLDTANVEILNVSTQLDLISAAESPVLGDVKLSITNSSIEYHNTEDESMAIEALRQLGNSTVYTTNLSRIETKTPQDLPLLPCSTCDLQFRTTADLQSHQAICKVSQYKCPKCNAVFDRKNDLTNHLVCHSVERPHSCTICGNLFIYKKALLQHMQTHGETQNNINQCQVCGATFNRPSSLTNHMKIHTYQPGRGVNVSTVQCVDQVKLLEVKGETSETIPDIPIKKEITPLPSIKNIKVPNSWNFNYDTFSNDTFTNFNLDIGQETVIEHEPPEIVAKIEVDEKRPHICNICQKAFSREKALLSHLNIHTLDNIPQCVKCDACFSDESAFQKHVVSCIIKTKNNELPMMQVVLEEQFQTALNSETKNSVNKHFCDECDKKFPTKQKLQRHKWIHRKKVFSCEICAVTFQFKDELDTHRLSLHQAKSRHVCGECGKNFSSRQGLWEHNRIHGPAPILYECTECSKTFTSRQGYLIHKRIHNNERPYGCRFCWKSFRDGGTLRKHERIHTGERPHACPICSRAFNQKVVLREHVRWLHAANSEPNTAGLYDCSLCDQCITDKDELCAHIVKHSDQIASEAKKANPIKKRTKPVQKKSEVKPEIIKQEVDELLSGPLIFECDMCRLKFLNKNELSDHVTVHI